MDCLGLENGTADSSPDYAITISVGMLAAARRSASLGPIHGLLSTVNADHHYNLHHRSNPVDSDGDNCPLIIACGGVDTIIYYFFRDGRHHSMAVAESDKKRTLSAHRMSGAWVKDKIDADSRTNGRTSKFANALGLG